MHSKAMVNMTLLVLLIYERTSYNNQVTCDQSSFCVVHLFQCCARYADIRCC